MPEIQTRTYMPQPLSGEKRRRGRPLSGHAKDIVLHIRCTPKQKEMFLRLGGADWLRSFLDTVGDAFDKKPEEVE